MPQDKCLTHLPRPLDLSFASQQIFFRVKPVESLNQSP
jgi:hypothetical protein